MTMFNERDISEKFNTIWKQSFPLLTPTFMKVFNENYVEVINQKPAALIEGIRYDLVSEAAFNLSQLVIEKGIVAKKYILSETNTAEILRTTAQSIWRPDQYDEAYLRLTIPETADILNICDNIIDFISKIKKQTVSFKPKLKGYGIISDLQGDLEIDDTLYEIKTVTRNFKSTDLKQLFIYLSLRQVEKGQKWKNAGLYNPRKGTFCKFEIKNLVDIVSGGRSPSEAFEGFLNSLTRDLEIDSIF